MSKTPIVSLIPPPLAKDERVRALLQAFADVLDEMEDKALLMLEASDVPEHVLPYLTFEHSLDEFIGSGLPASVIRRMIANAWDLHEPKGYQEGVEGGVAMLGLQAHLIQWFQETPKARRGTHRIEVPIDKPIWPNRPEINADDIRAVWRMVHAMQRWSQDHAVQVLVEATVPVTTAVAVGTVLTMQIDPYDPGPVEVETSARVGAGVILSRTVTIEAQQ